MFDRTEKLVISVCVLLILAGGTAIWLDSKSPHFQLKKSDWLCTREKLETTLIPVATGNSATLLPTTKVLCVEYRRTGT